jgi:hypothetical protein
VFKELLIGLSMSIELTTAVWKHSKQKSGGLLVLLAIADYANKEGIAWPAVSTLAKKTRMSPRNVQRWLRKIEGDGELITIQNQSGHCTNRFRICVRESRLISNSDDCDPRDDAVVRKGMTRLSCIGDVSVGQFVSEPSIESTPIVPNGDDAEFWIEVSFKCFKEIRRSLKDYIRKSLLAAINGA